MNLGETGEPGMIWEVMRFLPLAVVVLFGGISGVFANDELLGPARETLQEIGCSGLIQRRMEYKENPPRVSLTEIQVDLKTGTLKSHTVGGNCQENALKNGAFPAQFEKQIDWELWRVGDGAMRRESDQKYWVPCAGAPSADEDLNHPLAILTEEWRKIHFANAWAKRKQPPNGAVSPPLAYPVLNLSEGRKERIYLQDRLHILRKFTTEEGLVVREVYTRNDVTTEIIENSYVKSLDLSPPAELLEVLDRSAKERKAVRQKQAQ